MAQNIQIIKSMYGKEKYDRKESQQFGTGFIVGWYIIGHDALLSLEKEYNNKKILELWEKQKK